MSNARKSCPAARLMELDLTGHAFLPMMPRRRYTHLFVMWAKK